MTPKTNDIHHEIEFSASPHEVYELLMDSKKHSEFTGSACEISRKVGGAFTCYDGYIEGENLELEKDRKIVQKWRRKDFPRGLFSTVTFSLKGKAGKTILTFSHTGVPESLSSHLSKGWKEQYWEKMNAYLSRTQKERGTSTELEIPVEL